MSKIRRETVSIAHHSSCARYRFASTITIDWAGLLSHAGGCARLFSRRLSLLDALTCWV
jgi:hypothetical protein